MDTISQWLLSFTMIASAAYLAFIVYMVALGGWQAWWKRHGRP